MPGVDLVQVGSSLSMDVGYALLKPGLLTLSGVLCTAAQSALQDGRSDVAGVCMLVAAIVRLLQAAQRRRVYPFVASILLRYRETVAVLCKAGRTRAWSMFRTCSTSRRGSMDLCFMCLRICWWRLRPVYCVRAPPLGAPTYVLAALFY